MEVRLGGSEVQHKRRRVITRCFFGGLIPGLNLVQEKNRSALAIACCFALMIRLDVGSWTKGPMFA